MNEKKETVIEVFEKELWDKQHYQNEVDCVYSDFTGLYVDIIGVISKADKTKAGIIYDYCKMLECEIQSFSSLEAYILGAQAKNKLLDDVSESYVREVTIRNEGQRLYVQMQTCFNEIANLLDDKRELISDFTETYRRVHGVIMNNIHEFIRLGQTSECA